MAVAIHQIRPVAHLPLVLGVVRKLNVAALIETFCPPHPAQVLSCGRGVEALLLAILDGHHALDKVGARLEEGGIGADRKAYCKRTLGLCLAQRLGLITLGPRTCAVRQEVEAWGQQHGALPLWLETPS